MLFPYVSRSRFDDILREKNMQIGERDRRIVELEAERRMLWDKICLLGFGVPLFSGTPKALDFSPGCEPGAERRSTTGAGTAAAAVSDSSR